MTEHWQESLLDGLDINQLFAFINGRFVKGQDACIPIYDRGVQWGDGVYDSVRTYGRVPFKLAERLDRLFNTLRYVRINPGATKEDLSDATRDLLEKNLPLCGPDDELMVNYYVSRGSLKMVDDFTPAGTVAIFCRPVPFASFARFYVNGAPAMTPSVRRTPPQCLSPRAKVSNKMNHFLAELDAKAFHPDAYPLMLDLDGNITESSSSNFIFAAGGRIKVPNERFVLSGANMSAALELAERLGVGWDQGTYTLYDVYNAQEAFLTTTSFGILPVVSLNGRPIGDGRAGPKTCRLMDSWCHLVGVDFVNQALNHLPGEEGKALLNIWKDMRARAAAL